MMKGISSREDSFLIGFVGEACGISITLEEMKEWIYEIIKKHDDFSTYFLELLEIKNHIEFYNLVPFPTDSELTEKELLALFGIGFKRGIFTSDDELNISKDSALKALAGSPNLKKRFRETFSFIKW